LYYLPFEILPLEDGALLGERYPIVYAPSATVLHELRTRLDRRPAYEGEFVGFAPVEFASEASAENAPRPESEKTPPAEPEGNGDSTRENPNREAARRFALRGRQLSPLSASQDEVLAIRSMFGERGVVYLREQATEHRAKTATRGYRYVHFS
ncbi:MAG: CHAT domain-containing protein, partial [Armatimonadetes bacterium]|nr:CHAT domain-containing protein [Armatimonadota bacterium]